MIDWYNVFANSLWIFALALALATISFVRWEALSHDKNIYQVLTQPRWRKLLHIAGIVFSLGVAATVDVFWERVLWIVLALLFVVQVGMNYSSTHE